jgi:hypothetical protein
MRKRFYSESQSQSEFNGDAKHRIQLNLFEKMFYVTRTSNTDKASRGNHAPEMNQQIVFGCIILSIMCL